MARTGKNAQPQTYYVCIMHCHNGEYGSTVGSIQIGPTKKDERIAKKQIEFWLAQQTREHKCPRNGADCGVDVRQATGLKGLALVSMAKPIVPPPAASKPPVAEHQHGFTILEFLIVIAIIGIIAAIAVPSFMRAKVNQHTEPFRAAYGLDLASFAKLNAPPDTWLDSDQRSIIMPLVDRRLGDLCATPESRTPPVLALPPATDAFVVAERLQTLQRERANLASDVPSPERCKRARDAAAVFGLLPAEAP